MNSGEVARAATMEDVAREAGVSHQTVSRVLNAHPSVRPTTRDRVLAAIERLSYRRNAAARTLVTRRSQRLGVISFDTTLYGPASTLYGIENAAREAGYSVTVASVGALTAETIAEALERLAAQSVEGVVVIVPVRGAITALEALRGALPVVAVEGGVAPGFPVVSVDQESGARLVTRHLLDQGVDTVWHVAGPVDWLEAEARIAGWRGELRDSRRRVPKLFHGAWAPSDGYRAGRELAERGDVEAVFVANDQMALGVLRAFHEADISVPDDVLVAGFDDVPEAAYYQPPLTTVRQDFATVGRRSLELLIDKVAGPVGEDRRVLVQPELVVRHSSVRGATDTPRTPARRTRSRLR